MPRLLEWRDWSREAIEELYFGAKWIAGEMPDGTTPEVDAKLAELLEHFEKALEAIRAYESVIDAKGGA